jgi:hypothetical protein
MFHFRNELIEGIYLPVCLSSFLCLWQSYAVYRSLRLLCSASISCFVSVCLDRNGDRARF